MGVSDDLLNYNGRRAIMLKKVLVCSVVSMFIAGGAVVSSMAAEKGPAEITVGYPDSAKPKPAQFPHAKHQEAFGCGDCHHGMAEDGTQVPYSEDLEIKQCWECHTGDTLAGKKDGKLKLDTIKGAGHGNCLACHKEMAKKDPALKEKKIASCSTCHPKKK